MDFFKRIPTHMDFEGQRKAERIFQVIIIFHAIVGFAAGYAVQQFSWTVYAILFGFILSCIIILPPWPYFRQNPLPWQKVSGGEPSSSNVGSGAKSGGGNKKKK